MIAINLLPEDRRPVERTPLPRFLVIVGGVAGFCLEIVVLGMFALRFPEMRQRREGNKVQQERLKEETKLVDDIERQISRLKQRGDCIEKLRQDRRVWAPILYRLSAPEILSPAIWFRSVKLEQARGRGVRGAVAKKVLVLDGYARGPDSATMMQEVTGFLGKLRKLYQAFPDVFEGSQTLSGPKLQSLSGGRDAPDDVPEEVAAFTVTIPLKAVGAKAPQKKK